MDDLISVIVTVYNVEPYIRQCLESIVRQEYMNLEIILVDDGSTDGSSMVCDEYAGTDERIKVIHKSNAGVVQARKTGVQEASGKYVGYVDADDWIEPWAYRRLYEEIERWKADVAAAGRIEEFPGKSKVCKNKVAPGVYKGNVLSDLYSRMIFSGIFFEFGLYPTVWDKLFKRELLLENQMQVPDDILIGEDVACVYPCLLEAETICVVDDCFYHYRQREGSMLGTKDRKYYDRVSVLQRYLYARCRNTEYWNILEKQIDIYIMDMILNGARHLYGLKSAPEICSQFLFPFHRIKRGSRIALYGAGNVGQKFFRQIEHCGYCQIVCWADRDAQKFENTVWRVSPPCILEKGGFDYVVVCAADEELASVIKRELMEMGIEKSRLVWENPVY